MNSQLNVLNDLELKQMNDLIQETMKFYDSNIKDKFMYLFKPVKVDNLTNGDKIFNSIVS